MLDILTKRIYNIIKSNKTAELFIKRRLVCEKKYSIFSNVKTQIF
nr:MAG TPA: hypothetical protein [Caudoviricetes sp.]